MLGISAGNSPGQLQLFIVPTDEVVWRDGSEFFDDLSHHTNELQIPTLYEQCLLHSADQLWAVHQLVDGGPR